MPCIPFKTPDGARGFVCVPKGRTRMCRFCKRHEATLECDGPKPRKKKSGTCDAPICTHCRTQRGHQTILGYRDTFDLCPDCAQKGQQTELAL